MSERMEVGYICEKGRGHFSLAGMSDHGACRSHIAGYIYIELDGSGVRDLLDIVTLASDLKDWVQNAEAALDKQAWDGLTERITNG